MTPANMRTLLRQRIRMDFGGSQKKFAAWLGMSEPSASMVLSGKREPPGRVLDYLRLERVCIIRYRETDAPKRRASASRKTA